MAKMQVSNNVLSAPAFVADFRGGDTLIPGGGKLVAADFTDTINGVKVVVAGTIVGRTYTEAYAGTGLSPADPTGGDEQVFITAFDVSDVDNNNDVELVRPGAVIYEDRLHNWGTIGADIQAQIRSLYVCITSEEA